MEIVSPSGRVYKWEKDTPPTAEDIAELQAYDAGQGPAKAPISTETAKRMGAMAAIEAAVPGAGVITDSAAEGVLGAGGQAVGAMTGPLAPVALPVLGAAGAMAGNALGQGRRMLVGQQDKFQTGQLMGAGLAGAIPGGNAIKAPVSAALKGAATNVAAGGVETMVDQGRMPTGLEAGLVAGLGAFAPVLSRVVTKPQVKAIQQTVKQRTWEKLRSAGYVVPASELDPSMVNKILGSIAGREQSPAEAIIRNQAISNKLAAKALGVSGASEVTDSMVADALKKASVPYERVAAISAEAAQTLDSLKTARFESSEYFRHYGVSKDPASLKKARALAKDALDLENKLESIARQAGAPQLVPQLRKGRELYAKASDVDLALNSDSGDVSAGVLNRIQKKTGRLTGELATIAQAANSRPKYTRDATSVQVPGTGKLKAFASITLGGAGVASMGAPGAVMAALPFADGPARSLMFSELYQNRATNRFLDAVRRPAPGPEFVRLGTQAAGRNAFLDR